MTEKIFDNQFFAQGMQIMPRQNQKIYVVVAKPTRVCNADCSYCSSPPLGDMGKNWQPEWNIEKFKLYFDKVYPHMIDGAFWIWHGGEPMLMGVNFYKEAFAYAKEKMQKEGRRIHFSIQSNLLGYNEKWASIFDEIFDGSISTSFDPDEENRTIKGNPQTYSKVFKRVLNKMIDDGFRPMVIGVYSEQTAHLMNKMYDWSLSYGDKAFPLRFNYCHPTGRLETSGEAISPKTYGKALVELYNRWIKDVPEFTITPLDQMFKKVIGIDGEGHCPWTKKCGGRFIEIEPEGDVYNCADFADLGKKYCFGNLNEDSLSEMLMTKPALQIKRRSVILPTDCMSCEHFDDCEGGCARDAVLYDHGLYGKFHYCLSWKMVFTRIKESVILGQADNLILKYGENPEKVKQIVKSTINNHFADKPLDWHEILQNGVNNPYGFYSTSSSNMIENKSEESLTIHSQKLNSEMLKQHKINEKLKTIKVKVIV